MTNDNAVAATMQEVGHAIAKYLPKNTSVMYSLVGLMPGSPPTPDPVVSYVTNQIVGDFICTLTQVNDLVLHGIKLGKQITDGIQQFQIFPGAGFTVSLGGFLCAPPIILPPYPAQNKMQYWIFQSSIILTCYKAWIKPNPMMGSHSPYLAPPEAGAIMSLIY